MFRAGVVGPLAGSRALPTAFGRDDQAGGVGIESLGDQFFRGAWAIGVSSVDQVAAQFDSSSQRRQGRSLVGWRTPDTRPSDAHGSVAQAVDGEVASYGESARICG